MLRFDFCIFWPLQLHHSRSFSLFKNPLLPPLGLPTRPRHRPGLQCPGCEWLRMAAILQNDVFQHFRGKIRCNILQSPAILPQFYIWTWIWLNMIAPYCTTISDLNLRWFYFLDLFGICCCDPRISPEPFNCHPCRSLSPHPHRSISSSTWASWESVVISGTLRCHRLCGSEIPEIAMDVAGKLSNYGWGIFQQTMFDNRKVATKNPFSQNEQDWSGTNLDQYPQILLNWMDLVGLSLRSLSKS